MVVHSDGFQDHLHHDDRYSNVTKKAGFTLGLNKSEFVKSKINFFGNIRGSGNRSVDPKKVADHSSAACTYLVVDGMCHVFLTTNN
jgi:hypothetical protein